MKKIILFFLLFAFAFFWYGESRHFDSLSNKEPITVWKTYNNRCYVVMGKYYGLTAPSSRNYIKTFNNASGVTLIKKGKTDTVIVQIDEQSQIINNSSRDLKIVNYDSNRAYNDSLYTYYDSVLKLRRYKKGFDILVISINDMGAL